MKGLLIGTNRYAGLITSPVFDSYWRLAAERQSIFFKRIEGRDSPWTDDEILLRHKFTNAYRASDRVSQYLIREVIYGQGLSEEPVEVVFRILLFKLFNKIETWKLLEKELGPLSWAEFSIKRYGNVLARAHAKGHRIYSAAYIIPPVRGAGEAKHVGHLHLISQMMKSGLARQIQNAASLSEVFWLLKSYPSIGDFIAFQLAIDVNYSNVIDHSEEEFVVAGPGARDGLSKCFLNYTDFSPEALIEYMVDRQEVEFERLGIEFRSLWGRRLQLIDCQNLFCEISKYARVAHPEFLGVAGRTRIKQIFRANAEPLQPWYPPKWRLNAMIPQLQVLPASKQGSLAL
ncbi:nucleotide kinase domain-containing protein [Tardiphaga sp. 1201_B9_N1_1]|uniref:nucleotide kinase domain-containing protein n=1 Tax=unclassified Tardiphaga TaxID=2631404 RepID=UPI003F1F08CF